MATEPNILWGDRFLLTGPPKAGKSTMAATFPRPFVINTDGPSNRKYIYLRENPDAIVEDVYSYEEFEKALEKAHKKRRQWNTLILDLVDVILIWNDEEVVKSLDRKLRKSHFSIGEADHGTGWENQYAGFTRLIRKFLTTAEKNPNLCASIIIAHSHITRGKETLLMRNKLSKYLQGRVQHVAHVVKAKVKGELEFSVDFGGGTFREAGSRCRQLQSAGIITPPTYEALAELVEEGTYSRGHDTDIDEDDEEVTTEAPESVSPEDFEKAMAWLEKNGVRREDYIERVKALGLSKPEAYELVRQAKINDTLDKLKEEVFQ